VERERRKGGGAKKEKFVRRIKNSSRLNRVLGPGEPNKEGKKGKRGMQEDLGM